MPRRRRLPKPVRDFLCKKYGIYCDNPPTPENKAPVADAGLDQAVIPGAVVQLDGSGSRDPDGRIQRYQWTLRAPIGSTARIADATSPRASFKTDKEGFYIATLSVSDGQASDVDSVTIDCDAVPEPPDPPEPLPPTPPSENLFYAKSRTEAWSTGRLGWNTVRGKAIRKNPWSGVSEVFYVPWYYGNKQAEHNRKKDAIRNDANAALANAISGVATGSASSYSNAALLLDAWAGLPGISSRSDSRLVFAYCFPSMILAADLVRRNVPWSGEDRFADMLERVAMTAPAPLMNRGEKNNWSSWGLFLHTCCAIFLDRSDWIQQAASYYEFSIGHQIREKDGRYEMWQEVTRSGGQKGISYSNFSLMPLTMTAEALRVKGIDKFRYMVEGKSLERAWQTVSKWMLQPSSFPYYNNPRIEATRFSYSEILLNYFSNSEAETYLSRKRPVSAYVAVPFLTFTHKP